MTGSDAPATVLAVMTDYETQRQQHLTYATALAPRLIERLDWSADRLAAYRCQRLREVVLTPPIAPRGIATGSRASIPAGSTRHACASFRR